MRHYIATINLLQINIFHIYYDCLVINIWTQRQTSAIMVLDPAHITQLWTLFIISNVKNMYIMWQCAKVEKILV